jgi:quercetin dioxygenase-like cupin family protein
MSDNWHSGNATDESTDYRGWLVGHFIEPTHGAVRQTTNLEVKWGIHPAGQQRAEWTEGEERSTLVILVSGKFRIDLSVGSVTLAHQGDYLTWGPGIEHSWQAEDDSVVITVRWPSIP